MSKALLLSLIGTALSCALSTPSAAFARDWNAADMLYSRGVQAYFAGQDDEAEQYLTRAVQSNPNDPRPYYFRAMSRLRRGRDAEARQDMQAGAVVEARAPSRWAVGSALERVQGRDRLLLEDYRRRARLDEATRRDERNRVRYEQITDREPEVLRRAVEVPLDKLVQPTDPQELINQPAVSGPRAKSSDDSTPQPQQTAQPAPALDDPFADDAARPIGGDTGNSLGKPRPPAESDTGDESLFATPDNQSAPGEDSAGGDESVDSDQENPFGF